MIEMNWIAVIVAALSAFALGGLWYSNVLFGKTWCREAGVDPQSGGHPAQVFGLALVFSLIGAIALAQIIGADSDWRSGLHWGLIAGLGVAASSYGINYQFAQRSFKLWLIDAGYHTVQFALFGLILGAWPK